MPTGTIRVHDVIQPSNSNGTSLTRPSRPETLDSGSVRLFLSPATFNEPGFYQAAIGEGSYSFRNVNTEIQRKLDSTRDSRAFFRIDTGRRLRRTLYRSNQISEREFRRMGNVNFDLFRISVNEDAYLTKESVLEAMVVPEFVRSLLERLSVRVLGVDFDLINENEIERILGNIVDSINNFDVSFTNNKRLKIQFKLSNIRINLPKTAVNLTNSVLDVIGLDSTTVCEEYFIEELDINLFLKVTPNRTVSVEDQIRFTFENARLFIPNDVEIRGCPPTNDNSGTAPNPNDWEVLTNDIKRNIRELFGTLLRNAVVAALSPLHNGLMRYINIEMEAQFDRMMDTVISETIAQNDDIDVNIEDVTKTISHFRLVKLRRADEEGIIREINALKPVLIYGVLTSSPRLPRISRSNLDPRNPRKPRVI